MAEDNLHYGPPWAWEKIKRGRLRNMAQDQNEAWRELAIETIRNLSSLVEDAQALLRRAENQLRALEADRDDKSEVD